MPRNRLVVPRPCSSHALNRLGTKNALSVTAKATAGQLLSILDEVERARPIADSQSRPRGRTIFDHASRRAITYFLPDGVKSQYTSSSYMLVALAGPACSKQSRWYCKIFSRSRRAAAITPAARPSNSGVLKICTSKPTVSWLRSLWFCGGSGVVNFSSRTGSPAFLSAVPIA
jgi:hypothetical protein